jgi:hypothetical protein
MSSSSFSSSVIPMSPMNIRMSGAKEFCAKSMNRRIQKANALPRTQLPNHGSTDACGAAYWPSSHISGTGFVSHKRDRLCGGPAILARAMDPGSEGQRRLRHSDPSHLIISPIAAGMTAKRFAKARAAGQLQGDTSLPLKLPFCPLYEW